MILAAIFQIQHHQVSQLPVKEFGNRCYGLSAFLDAKVTVNTVMQDVKFISHKLQHMTEQVIS